MFRSVESALSWAFQNHSIAIVKTPGINRMYGKRNPGTLNDVLAGLNQIDRSMQAANIVGAVYALDDVSHREYICAVYGYERSDEQIRSLMIRAMGVMGTGTHRRRGVRDILLNYLGANIGQRQIRDDLQCNRNDVYIYRNRIFEMLDKVRAGALNELHHVFVQKGLVDDDKKVARV
ncbi:MAG: hypothetical protein H6937_02345 [Burkholderiales bacterium]|nr:hypothetical protein [Burkholderiales bacterium]